jgi:hypothetical protein
MARGTVLNRTLLGRLDSGAIAIINRLLAGGGFGNTAEAALATEEILYGGGEISGFEFRPHARREKQFRVSAFPKHEIAQAALAAGANQQVNVRSGASGVGDVTEAARKFALGNFKA